jgi:predicted nuclease of predicted toxin-antitoxin system
MRILLDSNLPRAFATLLPGHRTDTTHQRRWSDLDDGPRLDAAEAAYDAFVTMDHNLRFQHSSEAVFLLAGVVGAMLAVVASFARARAASAPQAS